MTKFLKKVPFSLSKNTEHINKKLQRPLLRAALFFIAAVFVLTGCKKPEEEIGIELQSDNELLHAYAVDTFLIKAYTVRDDSVRTDKLSPAIIGAYTDPVFGFTKAGHITQLRLSSNNPNLIPDGSNIDNIQVDSVILVLSYYTPNSSESFFAPIYGKSNEEPSEQYFEVFELTDSLYVDSSYYENTPVNHTGVDWIKTGFNNLTPNTKDSVMAGGVKLPPQMRIPLKEEFADRFFEASATGDLTATTFASLIKGIYIGVDETKFNTSDAGLISFDTFTGNSRITMYYSNVLADTTQSLQYSFAIRSNSAKYEHFEHDYAMADPSLVQQLNGVIASGQQDLYIQGNSGTKIFLELTDIEGLRGLEGVAINQAKIILPVRDKDTFGKFPPPEQLLIFPLDENGKIYSLQFDDPFKYGYFNKDKGVYEFLVTRHLQQVLMGEREHYGFEIVSISSGKSANRVVLNGAEYDSQNPSNNLKLAITFTKF